MDFIDFENKDRLQKAIKIYQESTLDLEDSYNFIYANFKKAKGLKTFDKILGKKFSQKQ